MAGVRTERPERRQLFQMMPADLSAAVEVPAAHHARLLDRPERAVGGEAQGEQIAVGMERVGAENAQDCAGTMPGTGERLSNSCASLPET